MPVKPFMEIGTGPVSENGRKAMENVTVDMYIKKFRKPLPKIVVPK